MDKETLWRDPLKTPFSREWEGSLPTKFYILMLMFSAYWVSGNCSLFWTKVLPTSMVRHNIEVDSLNKKSK